MYVFRLIDDDDKDYDVIIEISLRTAQYPKISIRLPVLSNLLFHLIPVLIQPNVVKLQLSVAALVHSEGTW